MLPKRQEGGPVAQPRFPLPLPSQKTKGDANRSVSCDLQSALHPVFLPLVPPFTAAQDKCHAAANRKRRRGKSNHRFIVLAE